MRFGYKLLIGAAAIGVASASSFPNEISAFYRASFPAEWTKRQALAVCEQTNATFVRYIASEREECYSRLRNAAALGDRTGIWSRYDRGPQMASTLGTIR